VAADRAPKIVVVVDAGAIVDPDLDTVDALARWQLRLQRMGATLRTCNASAELQDLLELAGLADVVALPVEPRQRAEEGEQE
jgi:anti-anti-sigma regulatory factor